MKVCHMTSAHPVLDTRIFYKECVSLAKAGYETYLVAQGESLDRNGVHIIGVGAMPSSRLKRMTDMTKRVYQAALSVDADIYHLHDPELLPYALKLKKLGKKVVFDSHEKYSEQLKEKPYLPRFCTEIIARTYPIYEKYVLKRIDGLIFPCLEDGKHPFAGMCRTVVTIDNFPLIDELYTQYDPEITKYPNSICYVGALTYSRGITHLVRATEKSKSTAYLGGVFSPPLYGEELKKESGYNNANYLGKLTRQQVLGTLQHCQIGMANILNIGQYNQFDNLATKVYEYMSLGLPVILTKAPYNVKVMEKYQFGICVDPENVDEIAEAIRYLLDHPEEAKQMGENGRRAVEEEFNWGTQERKLLELYRSIL